MPCDLGNGTPWLRGSAPLYTGAFRDNVRAFLTAHGTPVEDLGQPNVSCWMVHLQGHDTTLRLYVYEEELDVARPAVCDACRIIGVAPSYSLAMAPTSAPASSLLALNAVRTRAPGVPAVPGPTQAAPVLSPRQVHMKGPRDHFCPPAWDMQAVILSKHAHAGPHAGWQHHAVCMRRYHFIIPARIPPDAARAQGNLPALVESRAADPSNKAAQPIKGRPLLAPDLAHAAAASPSVFDSHSHLLHGLLHVNGFGHLLRINGREGGSTTLTGTLLHCAPLCGVVALSRSALHPAPCSCSCGSFTLRACSVYVWCPWCTALHITHLHHPWRLHIYKPVSVYPCCEWASKRASNSEGNT